MVVAQRLGDDGCWGLQAAQQVVAGQQFTAAGQRLLRLRSALRQFLPR